MHRRQTIVWERIDHTDGSTAMVPHTRYIEDDWRDATHRALAQQMADALAVYVERRQIDALLDAYARLLRLLVP